MLPIFKAFKCVCCLKRDNDLKMAIEHFFATHFFAKSGRRGNGIPMLITIERLLCKVENLDEELVACLRLKQLVLHGSDQPSDSRKRAAFRQEAQSRAKTKYYTCLICNYKVTDLSDVLNGHGWSCTGRFAEAEERQISSCWYRKDCHFCEEKILRVDSQMEKHLVEKHGHEKRRHSNRKPSEIKECVKFLNTLLKSRPAS